jgi:TetR/AcrR family transcriptional repressor of nem operon
MARPRQFDLDQAIDEASRVFQERGYRSASITDLLAAIGVEKGSLYKAFRDKRTLFLLALDRYLDRNFDAMRVTITTAPCARSGIERWLNASAETGIAGGCFAIHALVEPTDVVEDIATRLERQFNRMEELLASTVKRGTADGSLPPDLDPVKTSRLLLIASNGMLVSGRARFLHPAVLDAKLLLMSLITGKNRQDSEPNGSE